MSLMDIKNIVDNAPLELSPTLVAIDLASFLAMSLPPRELILSPWLPRAGLAMIGVGKTHLSLNIAYAVANGGSFLGWEAERPQGVLFVDGEMHAAVLQERLAQIIKMNGDKKIAGIFRIITPDLQAMCLPDLATLEGQDKVNQCITNEIDLIILDNLSCLVKSGKENESDSWQPIQTWLLDLRRQGKTVLIIHHAGKSGAQRGSSKKADVLDTIIRLERPEGYTQDQGAKFNIIFEKARGFCGGDAKPFEAGLRQDSKGNSTWTTSALKETTFDMVVRLLNIGLSQEEIAKEIHRDPSTISRHATKAYEKGLIKVLQDTVR